jgi:hypothetical protein
VSSKIGVTLVEHIAERDATFRLMRLVEWAGFDLAHFERVKVSDVLPNAGVILTMGDLATDLAIRRPERVVKSRGYVWPGPHGHVIPTVHPAFIQAGNARWSAPFINDIQKAVEVAKHGVPAQFVEYSLDPSPLAAYQWAQSYRARLQADPRLRLAFDIETPGKGDDEEDLDSDAPDRTWNIERIGFSCAPLQALSVPWAPEYMPAVRLLLGSMGDKVVWNAGFDVPRVRRAGVEINGTIHDGMVAWHILHTDLPKRLGFVAPFLCPWQPAWKHLSGSRPAYYNAVDADVEYRCMERIEAELRRVGMWEVYDRDVVQLEPILVHMQNAGMPVDATIRYDRACKLAEEQTKVRRELEGLMPLETRKIEHVYKSDPKVTTGLLSRPASRRVLVCSICGAERPGKPHFKRFKKKHNPCADGGPVERDVQVVEYYRLASFSPSRDQLVRYHHFLKRPLPTVWDKATKARKVSFNEENMKKLILRYQRDPVYNKVLEYRALDKLAGTYIGRPSSP